MNTKNFSRDEQNTLKYYVYLILAPDTRVPFYIGKGKGNRVFHHLKDKSDTNKVQKIADLAEVGKEPIIEILKFGLTEEQALLVEATAIDLIGLNNLTNAVRGHGSSYGTRAKIEDLKIELHEKDDDFDFNEPGLLIKISRRWSYDMTAMELYDSTRSCWILSKDRVQKAKYAFAVYDSVIREVYLINGWLAGGSTMVCYPRGAVDTRRLEFVGTVANESKRRQYIGKNVQGHFPPKAANPVQYVGGA